MMPFQNKQTVPEGYFKLDITEIWSNGQEVILLGVPSEHDEHNCDALGCGSFGPHIIARLPCFLGTSLIERIWESGLLDLLYQCRLIVEQATRNEFNLDSSEAEGLIKRINTILS